MKVVIFGKEYRVLKARKLENDNQAMIYLEEGIIVLHEDLVGEDFMRALMHEIGHGVIERLSLNQAELSDDLEEIIVDTLTKAFLENFVIIPKDIMRQSKK